MDKKYTQTVSKSRSLWSYDYDPSRGELSTDPYKVRITYIDDWCEDPDRLGDPMEFRLTYEGELYGTGNNSKRAQHKHEIRCVFNPQLRLLWETYPPLKNKGSDEGEHLATTLGKRFSRCGCKLVPLVIEDFNLIVDIKIFLLRPGTPGSVIKSGDLDNRIKTIFDALRMPSNKNEFGGYDPNHEASPFYCLLEDDKLISRMSVETDAMLSPLPGKTEIGDNDVRLTITCNLFPYHQTYLNSIFA